MRNEKRYSIFEKRGSTWVRMTDKSYPRRTARFVWLDTLCEPYVNPDNCQGIRKLQKVRF